MAVTVTIPTMWVFTEIVLCIKKKEEFPISGFPRSIPQEDARQCKLLVQDYCFAMLTSNK